MITIKTTYVGHLRTEAVHVRSGKIIQTDAPLDNQGKGETFSPTDLLAASFGSCMITIAGIAARAHGFDIDDTKLEITKVMASEPRRVSELIVDLFLPFKNYTSRQRAIIEKACTTCPVALSLHPDLKQTINFHY